MRQYQLINPDGAKDEIYLGESGRIYVARFCRLNPGWTWRLVDDSAPLVELQINDAVHAQGLSNMLETDNDNTSSEVLPDINGQNLTD